MAIIDSERSAASPVLSDDPLTSFADPLSSSSLSPGLSFRELISETKTMLFNSSGGTKLSGGGAREKSMGEEDPTLPSVDMTGTEDVPGRGMLWLVLSGIVCAVDGDQSF